LYFTSSHPRRSISRDFSLADHTLPTRPEPAWQKMAQSPLNDTTQPVDNEEEGQSSTMKKKKGLEVFLSFLFYIHRVTEILSTVSDNVLVEPVCRGCVNFEGTDRIEHIIHKTRLQKLQYGYISSSEPTRNKNSKPGTSRGW